MNEHVARLLESTNALIQQMKTGRRRLTSLQLLTVASVSQTLVTFLKVYEGSVAPELAADRKRMRYRSAAAELGRLGGSKGGKARAKNLSPERRRAIARLAVNARWARRGRPAAP